MARVASTDQSPDPTVLTNRQYRLFFVFEPIVVGLLIFPLLIIFWQAGWNFMIQWFTSPSGQHPAIVPVSYIFSQLLFLFIYLNQDRLYRSLARQKSGFCRAITLQCHSFVTAFGYVIQWASMWTLWDLYTTDDWLIMLLISIAAALALIALTGHSFDLVCAPFIMSYDSIEYNIRIGTSLVTEKVGSSPFEPSNDQHCVFSDARRFGTRAELYSLRACHLIVDDLSLAWFVLSSRCSHLPRECGSLRWYKPCDWLSALLHPHVHATIFEQSMLVRNIYQCQFSGCCTESSTPTCLYCVRFPMARLLDYLRYAHCHHPVRISDTLPILYALYVRVLHHFESRSSSIIDQWTHVADDRRLRSVSTLLKFLLNEMVWRREEDRRDELF